MNPLSALRIAVAEFGRTIGRTMWCSHETEVTKVDDQHRVQLVCIDCGRKTPGWDLTPKALKFEGPKRKPGKVLHMPGPTYTQGELMELSMKASTRWQ